MMCDRERPGGGISAIGVGEKGGKGGGKGDVENDTQTHLPPTYRGRWGHSTWRRQPGDHVRLFVSIFDCVGLKRRKKNRTKQTPAIPKAHTRPRRGTATHPSPPHLGGNDQGRAVLVGNPVPEHHLRVPASVHVRGVNEVSPGLNVRSGVGGGGDDGGSGGGGEMLKRATRHDTTLGRVDTPRRYLNKLVEHGVGRLFAGHTHAPRVGPLF